MAAIVGETWYVPIMGETMYLTTKKTIYSNFMPSKAEEINAQPYKITQTLEEIRDVHEPRSLHPLISDPWRIKKVLTHHEVDKRRIVIAPCDAFEHVFLHWSMEMTERVALAGKRQSVVVKDVTDKNSPRKYYSIEDVFFERGGFGEELFYVLGANELVRANKLKPGDKVGIFWDTDTDTFRFKVLSRSAG